MVDSYENVPVFRQAPGGYSPENLLGKAQVTVDEENGKSTITIEGGPQITEFLALGILKSFELNTAIVATDEEKARAWWSGQPR